MIVLYNGKGEELFSCYSELKNFIGQDDFDDVMSGTHPLYTLSYIYIT
tara:strand:+ start:430 stop:573 length:144 start_codon:yes stop_codon:yes gene_type:complete